MEALEELRAVLENSWHLQKGSWLLWKTIGCPGRCFCGAHRVGVHSLGGFGDSRGAASGDSSRGRLDAPGGMIFFSRGLPWGGPR